MIRLLRHIWFPHWRIRYLVEFHMKSGNRFQAWFWDISIKETSDRLTRVKYVTLSSLGTDPMFYIDIDEIEHIGIIKTRGFIRP